LNIVPVVYASDNNYIVPTIVSITSILLNKNKDTFYDFYILDSGIKEENKIKFNWPPYRDEYKIEFIPINLAELEQWGGNGQWPITTFGRFFVCDFLTNYNKCIYLDGDTLILDDLSELYNTDLTGKYLGGVKSPGTNYNVAANKHDVLSSDRERYFLKCINAGVLVLNLELLRRDGGGQYLQKKTFTISENLGKGKIVTDMDILNLLFVDKMEYLDLKYNFYINNIWNSVECHYFPFCFSRNVIEDAFSHPAILHYALPEKPWIYANANAVYDRFYRFSTALWYNYYKKSPLGTNRLRRKILDPITILWYYIKPLLKKNGLLLEIKRKITGFRTNSSIHDFFD
jgi:lipopolysaccharide biosynthesis glycosyltransferase